MANLQGLQNPVRNALYQALSQLDSEGIKYSIPPHGGFRTATDQQALYANRANNPNPVAAPGTSTHEKGNAVDINLVGASPQQSARASQIMQQWGFTHPLANDPPHWEYSGAGSSTSTAPPSLSDTQKMAWDAAVRNGVPPARFLGLIQTESSFNPNAKSSAGAVGLGQLMPQTAVSLGVKDRTDPYENLDASARYYRQQYEKTGDWDKALLGYNPGGGQSYINKVNQNIQPFKGFAESGDVQSFEQVVPFQPAPSSPGRTSASTLDLIHKTVYGSQPIVPAASVLPIGNYSLSVALPQSVPNAPVQPAGSSQVDNSNGILQAAANTGIPIFQGLTTNPQPNPAGQVSQNGAPAQGVSDLIHNVLYGQSK